MAKKKLKPKKFIHASDTAKRRIKRVEDKNNKIKSGMVANVTENPAHSASANASSKLGGKHLARPLFQLPKKSFNYRNLFPKNKRFITEAFSASFLAFLVVFLGIILMFYLIVYQYEKYNDFHLKQVQIQKKLTEIEHEMKLYPNMKDLYLNAAILEYNLGESTKAKDYINKALLLDPNDKNLIEVKSKMNL